MSRRDSYIDMLNDKIKELIQLAASLKNSNDLMSEELRELRGNVQESSAGDNSQSAGLEKEVRKLKKENKSLKEKNKLIQNKAERLVTKLNELGL